MNKEEEEEEEEEKGGRRAWSIVSKADDRSKRMNIDLWRAFTQATCGRSAGVIRPVEV